MLLATRCPHCETVFRLQQAQLESHGGLVRCGHCQQVFNASESLVREPMVLAEFAPAEAAQPDLAVHHGVALPDAAQPDFSPLKREANAEPFIVIPPSVRSGDPDPTPTPMSPSAASGVAPAAYAAWKPYAAAQTDDASEPTLPSAVAAHPAVARATDRDAHEPRFSAAPAPFAVAPENDRPPFAATRETRQPPRRALLGGFVGGLIAAALAILLVAQLAWWQRETLTIDYPITQRWFALACAPLGCTVAPPRAIDGLRLEPASLRQLDGPRVLELKAPLSNRSRVALAYPSIELTLFDDANRIMVRRVIAPRDYAPPGTPIEAGLPAGATQTMRMRVDTNGEPASNFLVKIFYP